MVGRMMSEGAQVIKALTFDAHHSHKYLRAALFGDFNSMPRSVLEGIEFFSELTYEDIPQFACPRLPLKICRFRGSPVIALPGACDLLERFGQWGF